MSAAVAGSEAYHFSKRPLTEWGEFASGNVKSRTKIGNAGKPIGFWYAYNTTWSNTLTSSGESVGAYKYRFLLREFTDDPSIPNPSAILRLSAANFDVFMEKYLDPKFVTSPKEKLATFIYEYFITGESPLIEVLPEETQEELEENEGDYETITSQKILNAPKKGKNKGKIFIGGKALSDEEAAALVQTVLDSHNYGIKDDPISMFDWIAFWKAIAVDFAGVEFTADLIVARNAPRNIRIYGDTRVEISWLRLLDVVSGCIFNPETYFEGKKPSEFLVTEGGRRKITRRHKRSLRPAPDRCANGQVIGSNKKGLLGTVPRRLSATRRTRSRVERRTAHPK